MTASTQDSGSFPALSIQVKRVEAHTGAHVAHAESYPSPSPAVSPPGHRESAPAISRHDVQALIVQLTAHAARVAQVNPWLEVWGRMLALRLAHWPLAALNAAQRAQWQAWAQAQPDSPCIAVCSTAQGDAVCRGCRRTFDEVKAWPALSLADKRLVWARLLG